MRVLLFEFVCGGGWLEPELPLSLSREGSAMWAGLVSDLLALPGVSVMTTWDARFGSSPVREHPALTIAMVHTPGAGLQAVRELASSADVGLVIAPETDGLLAECCRELRIAGLPLLNCDDLTLQICGDKLATWRHCVQHGIPTIATKLLTEARCELPCVVKLRDGAGSQEMRLVRTQEEWSQHRARPDAQRFIVQPYIAGRALSVGGIFRDGQLTALLPVAEQLLSGDGEFRYLGGRIPAMNVEQGDVEKIIRSLAGSLRFHGDVGFDLLQRDDAEGSLCLVEINPRLTTSYVGYRKLLGAAVAECLLTGRPIPLCEIATPVRFSAAGEIV